MAASGANILVNYYDNDARAEELAAQLSGTYKVKAQTCQADVSKQEEVSAMFMYCDRMLGPVDVLVNNAGCETIDHAIHLDHSDWDRVFDVNLKGAFLCAQEAGRRMTLRQRGLILNISSIHDRVPRKGLAHYCSAKAGLSMLSKCLALELAEHNIRVVSVSPGAIETEMNRDEIAKFGREKFNGWIPLGRIGVVDDVAWTSAFLASDMASYITATEIYIDGGYKESTIPYDPRPISRSRGQEYY
jgi:glucose 1-dehydrogenase/3-dehydrosphinganine reductase